MMAVHVGNHSFWFYLLVFMVGVFARYVIVAGGAYALFYSRAGEGLPKRSLRSNPPSRSVVFHDIGLGIVSSALFAIAGAVIMVAYDHGFSLLYPGLEEYGYWYLPVSFVAALVYQDAYFYATHRLFHHPWFFKRWHRGHHRSGDPTPWTSFAFDALEAAVHAFFLLLLTVIIPLHFGVLVAVLLTMTVWAVLNHLGYKIVGRSFTNHPVGKWLIGPTHHSRHHRKYVVNYGLYFTYLDRWFGTEDQDDEEE